MVKRKMEERIGCRGQNESQIVGDEKRNGRLVGAVETSKQLGRREHEEVRVDSTVNEGRF